jgi:hypothetical protein
LGMSVPFGFRSIAASQGARTDHPALHELSDAFHKRSGGSHERADMPPAAPLSAMVAITDCRRDSICSRKRATFPRLTGRT